MKRKFTLVEILVVIAIIGILTGMALGLLTYVSDKTARTATQTTIKMLEVALENYKNKFGYYPILVENGDPSNFILDKVNFLASSSTTDPYYYKNNIWGTFNDVTTDSVNGTGGTVANRTAKIRGIRIEFAGNNYQVLDGWRKPIIYVYPGVFNSGSYDLISFGKDKLIGSSGKEQTAGRKNFETLVKPTEPVDDISNFVRD